MTREGLQGSEEEELSICTRLLLLMERETENREMVDLFDVVSDVNCEKMGG